MSSASAAISALNASVNSFESRIEGKVVNVHNASCDVQSTSQQIYAGIEKFKTDMMHGEQTQIAHENIMRIDQILKEQFGSHEAIRKTIIGVVRDFDINLVRNSTIQELSEELWITSSRYWLSYALIAVTAWVNNYPDVARNALAEAGRRDAVKTTLFFCLMNLRFDRLETAKQWFFEYMNILDPTMLQRETEVMVQAFLNGLFGKDKELEDAVLDTIDEWIAVINADAALCEELVDKYEAYIRTLHVGAKFEYQAILDFCTNADQVQASYREISKFDDLMGLVEELDVEPEAQYDENYRARVDAVLMDLISKYDDDELILRNEQARYRFIVEHEGDLDAAEEAYDAFAAGQSEHFNIGKQMIQWVLFDEDQDVNIQVRKFGFQNTRNWFAQAVERWAGQVHAALPLEYHLSIDGWTGVSNGSDAAEQNTAMKNYYENNKFQNMFLNIPNITAAIILVLSLGLAFVSLYSLVASAVALVVLVVNCLRAFKNYPQRVARGLANLNACMAQLADFRRYYDEKRAMKAELLQLADYI